MYTGGHGYNENWPTFRTLICPHFYKYKHQKKIMHACSDKDKLQSRDLIRYSNISLKFLYIIMVVYMSISKPSAKQLKRPNNLVTSDSLLYLVLVQVSREVRWIVLPVDRNFRIPMLLVYRQTKANLRI